MSHEDPNSVERFTGLADVYAKNRPGYPPAALDFILAHCGLGDQAVLVDVGCGTGISSRLFARRGLRVIGVEPNDEMRRQAEAEALPPEVPAPSYRAGRGEATGLPDACADAVLAAQAFHWFDAPAALCEFHRILKPGGWAVLVWNERDETDPCTAAYGSVIGGVPGAAAVEGPRARAGEALHVSTLFGDAECVVFGNQQEVDEDGLLGRALSASYAPREPAAVREFAAALRAVFAPYQRQGRVVLRYQTSVHVARRVTPARSAGEG